MLVKTKQDRRKWGREKAGESMNLVGGNVGMEMRDVGRGGKYDQNNCLPFSKIQ